jgi:hypothetical protein
MLNTDDDRMLDTDDDRICFADPGKLDTITDRFL